MFGRGRERRGLAKVDEGAAPIRELHRHEATAAEIARGRIHDRQRVTDGDGGIDRVAAVAQDVDADARRVMLGRDHHAVARRDRRGRCGVACAREQQDDQQTSAS